MPRAVKHAAPRAAEHAATRDRSAEHAAARTLDALPTFVNKPFVPLEAELKNPKRLDETERRLDAWLKRQERATTTKLPRCRDRQRCKPGGWRRGDARCDLIVKCLL